MKIYIQLHVAVSVFIPLFVEYTSSLSVCFTHEIVLTLTPETESFGGTRITTIPSLSGTALISDIHVIDGVHTYLCRNLLRKLPCLKASARALR
jgi:hypothetical protein